MEPIPPPLARKLFVTRKELLDALSGTDFYIEWLYIGVALALAWLLAALIRKRVGTHLRAHPPKRIDAIFITRPLKLLGPLLALLYLSVARPISENIGGGAWTEAVTQLTIAYLVARCVTLVVRARFISYLIATVIMISAVLDVTGFMPSVTGYLDTMAFEIGKFRLSVLNLIHGTVILVIVFWLAAISSSTLESYLRRSSSLSYTARELTVKFFKIVVYFIALMVTLSALGVDLTAFAVFGGALGVGIGLGLQKITTHFVSGIALLLEKSIKIGDVIEVGGINGIVRELNIRYALVETADGREMMIPNDELTSTRVTSWTHSHDRARVEIPVNVSYAADAVLARKLMLEAAIGHSRCLKDPAPDCWLREFGVSSLNFLLVFWIKDIHEGRPRPQSEVMFAILEKFRQNKIEIPSAPQTVVIKNTGTA
jgi:small-conductance mechanosensitive channel